MISQISGCEDKVGEPGIFNTRIGEDFDWLGGHSGNYEALEVSLPSS